MLSIFFKVREKLLDTIYDKTADGIQIGIPRLLHMHEFAPFWKSFLTELGFSVCFSDATNKKTIRDGVENIIVETCFPVKLAHGHVLNLMEKGVKRIFIPSVISLKKQSESASDAFACPYAQSLPYTMKASINFKDMGIRIHTPIVYFGEGNQAVLEGLIDHFKRYKISKARVENAFRVASEVQDSFYRQCVEKGLRFLSSLKSDDKVMVIIGRPYNSADAGANLNIHKKLINLGVYPVPMDMLPLDDISAEEGDLENMYWGYGQKILRAARFIKSRKNFYAIYLTSFGCGPDSFIAHFFKKVMGDKPYLQLEIDEHSADAGMITRLEAFIDSIKNAKIEKEDLQYRVSKFGSNGERRKIYLPYMSDHAIALSSAFKACGVDAEIMEESEEATVVVEENLPQARNATPVSLQRVICSGLPEKRVLTRTGAPSLCRQVTAPAVLVNTTGSTGWSSMKPVLTMCPFMPPIRTTGFIKNSIL